MRKKKREKKDLRFLFLIIPILFFVLVLGVIYHFFSERTWKETERFNILDAEALTFTSYSEKNEDLIFITLPKEYYVEVAGGYGNYKLKNVYELSKTEQKKDLLKTAVSDLLGIPIDAFSSDLTIYDKVRIWLIGRRQNKTTKEIDLNNLPIYVEETLVDGSKVRNLSFEKIDFYLSGLFWERKLREENFKIGIFNASEKPGLAIKTTRLIENIGGKVVEAGNFDKEIKTCQITAKSDIKESATMKRIRTIFPFCEYRDEVIDPRFDLIIVILSSQIF